MICEDGLSGTVRVSETTVSHSEINSRHAVVRKVIGGSMRILVVNVNTTKEMTKAIGDAAREVANPGT